MKKVFARIGMYLTVSDEEYERMKKDYSHEDNLSIEDCKRFCENGHMSVAMGIGRSE